MSSPTPAALPLAVIGAGACGLLAARRLQDAGLAVQIFDKGRGPGGRLATRRVDRKDPASRTFDHGAPSVQVQEAGAGEADSFRAWIDAHCAADRLAPWRPRTPDASGTPGQESAASERYVAVPSWGAFARHLAEGLDLHTSRRVSRLRQDPAGAWHLDFEQGPAAGPFARVLVTVPGPQAAELLSPDPELARLAASFETTRCWTAMLGWAEPLGTQHELLEFGDPAGPLTSAWSESSKPGRPPLESWTVQASPAWSAARWDQDPSRVLAELQSELAAALGLAQPKALPEPEHAAIHRWGFAACRAPAGSPPASQSAAGLALAGDALGAAALPAIPGRVPRHFGLQAAWTSARAAAAQWAPAQR